MGRAFVGVAAAILRVFSSSEGGGAFLKAAFDFSSSCIIDLDMAVIWEMPSDKSGLTFEFVGIGAGGGGGGGGGAGVGGSGGGEGWGVCR